MTDNSHHEWHAHVHIERHVDQAGERSAHVYIGHAEQHHLRFRVTPKDLSAHMPCHAMQ
jgi:hypothetical protein